MKNNRNHSEQVYILKTPSSLLANLTKVFTQKQTWLIATLSAASYCALEYLSENSGTAFLATHGISANKAANLLSIGWIGYGIGAPLLGYLSDWMQTRKKILIIGSAICLLSLTTIVYIPANYSIYCLAFFGLGIGASTQTVGFATMSDSCHPEYLAAGLSFNNMMITLTMGINAPVIGYFLTRITTNTNITLADYQLAFIPLVAFAALSLIIAIFGIKETFCKSTKVPTEITYGN